MIFVSRSRRELTRSFLLVLVVVYAGCSKTNVQPQSLSCNLPENVLREVSDARALPFSDEVACRYETREQIKDYLLSALWKKNSVEKLLFEGELYHALGFLPPDYEYLKQIAEFFSGEISGYYKAEDGSYVMRYGSDPVTQRDTVRHELTHALQDQHYDIEALLPSDLPTDALLARTAVLEGDADRIMLDLSGTDPCAEFNEFSLPSVRPGAVPPALRLFLNFPYVYGRRFWCVVGKARIPEQVMQNMPQSTREILHPELYLSESERLKDVYPAVEPDARFGLPIYRDVLGEFGALALLATYLPIERAQQAASELVADGAWVFKELNPDTTTVVWKSIWPSAAKAREFEHALVTANKLRFSLAPSVIDIGGPRVSYFNVAAQRVQHLSIAQDEAVVEVTVLTQGDQAAR